MNKMILFSGWPTCSAQWHALRVTIGQPVAFGWLRHSPLRQNMSDTWPGGAVYAGEI